MTVQTQSFLCRRSLNWLSPCEVYKYFFNRLVTSEDSIAGLEGDSLYYKAVGQDSFAEVKLADIGKW